VAVGALKAGPHMHGMGEIDEVWKALQPDPLDGFLVMPVGRKASHAGRGWLNGLMAPHTEGNARDAGRDGFGGMPVTKHAVDLEAARVHLMAEIEGLDILGTQIRAAGGVQETK
jgi:hypothetical protein